MCAKEEIINSKEAYYWYSTTLAVSSFPLYKIFLKIILKFCQKVGLISELCKLYLHE